MFRTRPPTPRRGEAGAWRQDAQTGSYLADIGMNNAEFEAPELYEAAEGACQTTFRL